MAPTAKSSAVDRLRFERALLARGLLRIAGVDEAGRGPLAGPVTAAAVILPSHWLLNGLPPELQGLNDSKQLSPAERERFYTQITQHPEIAWQVASVDSARIDAVNILRATHEGMNQTLSKLDPPPEHILIDGLAVPSLGWPQTAIVKGDALSYSIAAASIIAKVTRDLLMVDYDRLHPHYGFAAHKGYATPDHLDALKRLGPCPIHRRSFAPLKPAQTELFPDAFLVSAQVRP